MARKKKRKGGQSNSLGAPALGPGRPPSSGNAAVSQLAACRQDLVNQINALRGAVDGLDTAMAAIGGSVPHAAAVGGAGVVRARRGRPPGSGSKGGHRSGSLKGFIVRSMQGGGEMAVKDIANRVKKMGYQTTSASFANQVSNALAKMDEVTKAGRGRYHL